MVSFETLRRWITKATSEEHKATLLPNKPEDDGFLRIFASDWNAKQKPQPRCLKLGRPAVTGEGLHRQPPELLPWECRDGFMELTSVEVNLNWREQAYMVNLRKLAKHRSQLEFYTLLLDFLTKDQYRRYLWQTRARDDANADADADEAWEQDAWPIELGHGTRIWQVVYQLPIVIWVRDVGAGVRAPEQGVGADGRAWLTARPPQHPPPGYRAQPWPTPPQQPPPSWSSPSAWWHSSTWGSSAPAPPWSSPSWGSRSWRE